jgi:hypothetical protein
MLRFTLSFSALLLVGINLSGQSIQRSTLSAFGSSTAQNGVVMQTCVGQPSPTNHRQGFIQPPLAKTKVKNAMSNVRVYPVPSQGSVTLEYNFKSDDEIRVYDMNSSLVFAQTLLSDQSDVNFFLDHNGAGRYSAVVYRDGNGIALGTIVITK